MGQSMSRALALLNSYLPTARRRQQENRSGTNNNGITEYSDDMSITIGGGKGCGSLSGGNTYFGNHFLMGGELYDTTKPDIFLFGDQQDLELLGNKPIKFPYCAKGVTDSVNVINALVNARKDSIKFTKVGRAGTSYSSGFYRLEFIFDCDVSCYVQIHFCAKEFIDDMQIQIVGRQNHFNSSERYHFPIGANQQFSHFIFKPHRYDLKMMHWDGGLYFPLIIEIRSVTDRLPEQVQLTNCSIERSTDQSAALILKPLKQKLISNGVVFLLQEIFGIENKENAECALAEENGAECIICMANPRDTMILPCRHLCICNGCAETLRYKLNNCPICRSPFKALLKIRAMRSSLIGMGSDGTASTMRIRREPLTLFEAINGPFHTGSTPLVPNKTQTLAKCSMSGNVITSAIPSSSTNEILNVKSHSPKVSTKNQRQSTINCEGGAPIKVRRWDQSDKVELDIEQIELEEMDSKRRKISNSAGFIQYSPGRNSITRRSSPSPPSSLRRANSPFSTANSSYQSARSIAQKIQSEEEREKDNKNGNELLTSAPNLILHLEEISAKNWEKRKEIEKSKEKINEDKHEKRLKKGPIKRLSEPPMDSTSSSTKSSIPVKQRHKTIKAKSLTEQDIEKK